MLPALLVDRLAGAKFVLFSGAIHVILSTNITVMAAMRGNLRKQIGCLYVLLPSIVTIGFLLVAPAVSAIARGYATNDSGLQTGMVVALSSEESSEATVERATQENSDKVVGIVTTLDDSLVTVSSGTAKVLVESAGQTEAYVSDLNGGVAKGDLLVLSPLKGILMKTAQSGGAAIAIAAETPGASETYTYEDNGDVKETRIAKTKVNLDHQGGGGNVSTEESALAKLGRSVVGKEVDEIRVIMALILFVIVLVAEGGIIYGAVSSAITALGRNPLAKIIIRMELFRVIAVAMMVLAVGLGAVFAILWV